MSKAYGVTTIKEPGILLGRKGYILLLSHPRAYSSLLSHILGSHPDIIGSSETFDPYVKGRDLLRLRYKAYWYNGKKSDCKYVFDKVLFNFPISAAILNRHDVKVIFSLRRPAKTIRSMIKTHHDLRSRGGFWDAYDDAAKCSELYMGRLKGLEQHCLDLTRRAIYFDAEDMLDRTAAIFQALKAELDLSRELSEEYRTFDHTGVAGGDQSPRITQGRISRDESDRSDIVIPEDVLAHAQEAYDRCRSLLRDCCSCP